MDFEKGKNDLFLQEAHGITQLILKGMDKDSKFFHENRSYPLPRFELNQVLLDDKELGIGEFGVVHAVKGFQNVSDSCNCAKCCIPKPKIIAQVQDLASQNSEVNLRENTQIFPSISGNSSSLKRHRKESSVSFSENLVLKIMGGCPGDDESTLSIEDDDNAIDLSLEETGVTTEISLLRGFMSSHHIRQGRPRYATKRIQSDLPKSQLLSAITDLAAEAKFMSSIRHPNICKMRGTISSPGKNDFVIIMDCLVLTLTEKMKEWKEEEENGSKSIIEKLLMHNRNDQYASKLRLKEDRFADKLLAMYDVARALRYLHNHLIIFRDLKPCNLAFDNRGDLRMFDFGLAKELKAKDLVGSSDLYNATGLTGSRRYMAPEVVLCKNYGLSADVYSFAILFWEVLANQMPFAKMNFETHFQQVVQKEKRPSIKKMVMSRNLLSSNSAIHHMLEQAWGQIPYDRPKINKICHLLGAEIMKTSLVECNVPVSDRTTWLASRSLNSMNQSFEVVDC